MKQKVTIAKGDGIGPEIMEATLRILSAAGAQIETEEIEVGEKVYLSGNTSGIAAESWDVIRRNKVFLKAPITTPQGGGYKSLNVTTRKFLGLYSNVRPCLSLHPFVATKHPLMDIVIVRENEEDLYAGIEHQQTDEVIQCLKLISRPGCEKIVRYAFEYARVNGRKKVTCFTKDNIMKQTDGLFPLNLYGDVLSDISAQIAGSVGLAGSANIGEECAMFEAIHGSAPRRAGQDVANPSGLLQGAIMMLCHIGQTEVAEKIQNAWLRTIEDGIHTYDIFKEGISSRKVGTKEFAQAVIANLGKQPLRLNHVRYTKGAQLNLPKYKRKSAGKKELVGVDVFVHWSGEEADQLASKLEALNSDKVKLSMITNRGIKVWPQGFKETFCTDHWRCRFKPEEGKSISNEEVIALLQQAFSNGIDAIKTENLYAFDGKAAYSLGQGQ